MSAYHGGMSAATVQPLTAAPLTAQDRCDRCGAQAYVRATLNAGGTLLFCAHDWATHGDAVTLRASSVQDERSKLSA